MDLTSTVRGVTYLGDYRPYRNPCELPCYSGLVFSGWVQHVCHDDPTLSSRTWAVQIGDIQADVICESNEADFLAQCVLDELDCWTSGFLLLASTKAFYPLGYSVYGTRGPVHRLSAKLAEYLTSNAVTTCVRDVFVNPVHTHVSGASSGVCRPVAYATLMQKASRLREDPETLRALFFLAHCEASTATRSSVFYGQDAARLGSSTFTYRMGGGSTAVQKGVSPKAFPGEVVRGCALVGPDGTALLAVLSALLEVDDSSPTLIIAERDCVPFIEQALKKGGRTATMLLTISDYNALLFESSSILLVSVGMFEHSQSEAHLVALRRRPWHRLVTVGWPQVSQELEFTNTTFSYQMHLCLAVTEDLQAHECLLDTSAGAALLGLSEGALQDAPSVSALLRQRVFHLCPFDEGKQKAGVLHRPELKYSIQNAPAVDSDEAAKLCGFRGTKRLMRTLFGSVCGSKKGSFSVLAEGTSVLEHFMALSVRLTPFAVSQLHETQSDAECPVCFEPNPPVVTSCGHRYCQGCLEQSLSTQRRCPACRAQLHLRDVVHTRARADTLGVYLEFLIDLLKKRTSGKALVLASWGEAHENLAAGFRRKGLANFWAWRGGSKQLCINLQRFSSANNGTLLVDPGSDCFSLSWANFSDVSLVYVLWPLNFSDGQDDVCCQLRRVKTAAPAASFVLVVRERCALLPVTPTCIRQHTPGLECPVCVFNGLFHGE